VLAAARLARPALDRTAGLELGLADGRALPWPDGTFDVAHASMVLHHLDRDDAIAFLRELRRVARSGIVANDLVRGRLNWIGGWLLILCVLLVGWGPIQLYSRLSPQEQAALLSGQELVFSQVNGVEHLPSALQARVSARWRPA
jgi:SAM-dependent methyltransferase